MLKWTRENSCYILTKNLLTFYQLTTGELITFAEEMSSQHLAIVRIDTWFVLVFVFCIWFWFWVFLSFTSRTVNTKQSNSFDKLPFVQKGKGTCKVLAKETMALN